MNAVQREREQQGWNERWRAAPWPPLESPPQPPSAASSAKRIAGSPSANGAGRILASPGFRGKAASALERDHAEQSGEGVGAPARPARR
jgi:hypothetical protein